MCCEGRALQQMQERMAAAAWQVFTTHHSHAALTRPPSEPGHCRPRWLMTHQVGSADAFLSVAFLGFVQRLEGGWPPLQEE
jgi:hypothetical protein